MIQEKTLLAATLLLLMIGGCSQQNSVELLPIPDRLVVMTIDDGNKSDITYVAPLLKQYGFGATFYITEAGTRGWGFGRGKSGVAAVQAENFVSWEDVRRLHDEGFEMAIIRSCTST